MILRTCLIALAALLWIPTVHAQERLVFTSPENPMSKKVELVLKTAYGRLGIAIEVVHMPGKRALLMSNTGIYDGELIRSEVVLKQFENLIKVPVPISELNLFAFTHGQPLAKTNWEGLKGLNVGITIGSIYAEVKTAHLNPVRLVNTNQLFKMLSSDRIDVVIVSRNIGKYSIRTSSIPNIIMNEPPLFRSPIFHMLHKKHQLLLPKITAILSEMKKSGQIEKIVKVYLEENSNMF